MALGRGLLDRLTGGTAAGGPAAPAPAAPAGGGFSGGRDRAIVPPPGPATRDPIGRLPEAAADRLRRLREQREETNAILRDLNDRRREATEAKLDADRRLGRLQTWRGGSAPRSVSSVSHYMRGGGMDPGPGGIEITVPPSPDQVAAAQADLEAAKGKVAELDKRIAKKQRSRLPDNLLRWIEDLPVGIAIGLHLPEAAATKAAPTIARVEAARSRINELKAEISVVRSAPPPAATVKTRMRQQIAQLAERGRPNYLGAIEAGQPIKFPELQVQAQIATGQGVGVAFNSMPDMLGLFCWLHGEEIIAGMEADIDELADDEGAISDEEKQERETQLRAQILEVEREEEVAIEALETGGAPIQRRDDADPRAVLSLSSDLPVPGQFF